ncbi:MAG TPA: hypothetical protein VMS43_17525 [Allosphingosinicella sp.]|nr:hypothetical protein [Allosphingosinicella sp.]
MTMSHESKVLWNKLMDKLLVLEDAKKRLDAIPSDLKPDYEGIISSTFSEIQQVRGMMTFLVGGADIEFPSDEQIEKLRASVGALAAIVHTSQDFSDLVVKLTAVLNSWPVSTPG